MSKSMHARKPRLKVVTRMSERYDYENGCWTPVLVTVTGRDVLRKDADREYEEMMGNFGPRPYQGKNAAIHEGLLDLMDVQDEQSIAQDGITERLPFQGATSYSTRTPQALAVVLDMDAQAKAKQKAKIAQDMAEGVIYRDIDPYTLEPYSKTVQPSGFGKVSRSTATSRRNHAKASSWA